MLVVMGANPASGEALKTLRGHVPAVVAHLSSTGRLAATNQMQLAIGLPLRDPSDLSQFLAQLYDPASPNYRHYLTPDEFAARFGPTEGDYEAVKQFAHTNGLAITATYRNRLVLDVAGPVAAVEKAFHIVLRTYKHPTEGRDFFAPDTEPMVDMSLSVADISGLNNYRLPHPKLHQMDAAAKAIPKNGSAPDGSSYMGSDFRKAYAPGVTLRGSGQVVGVFEFDGYYANDIASYESQSGYTNVPLSNVLLNGVSGLPGFSGISGAVSEVSLDIEQAIAIAPALAKVLVYEGSLQNSILSQMASDDEAMQLSCSWGWSGGPTNTTDDIFQEMISQGQSFFNASGDADAFAAGSANDVDDPSQANAPSSSPYIMQVGGTTLTTGPNAVYDSETVWSESGGVGSSGGISTYYTNNIEFSWQALVSNMAGRGGSTANRDIPDVAFVANNVWVIYNNGRSAAFGGTSCAAPLWAGFMALVNQQAAAMGRPTAGFINPAIYAIGAGAIYTACFHDITTGNNTWSSSPNLFYATNGYDLCTGWGTPIGANLIAALNDAPVVSPANGFGAVGPVGGPFIPVSQTFTLTNLGDAPINWSLINTSAWLTVSPASGTLPASGYATVIAGLSSSAGTLPAGIYNVSLVFTNSLGLTATLPFALFIGQPVILNGGFETGSFADWTRLGSTNFTSVASGSSNAAYIHSGTYAAKLGPGSPGYLTQNLITMPGQNYLLSLWLRNPTGGTPNQFQVQLNDVMLFAQTNITSTSWNNLQFLFTAASAITPLQFGFQNTPDYFGLDDISVTPLAPIAFESIVESSTGIQLVWNTSTGIAYQVQYKTNLLQSDWINLGGAISSQTGTLSMTDTNAFQFSPQRFYRLLVTP